MTRVWLQAFFGLITLTSLSAQTPYAPPPAEKLDPAVLKAIEERTDRLGRELENLAKRGVKDPIFADIEIFHKAAVWIVKHGEFYHKDAAAWTLAMLDRGLLRASQQRRGEAPWLDMRGYSVVRAYRSAVDGSVQPYAVTFPADYGKVPTKKWRLDVVLHGRNPALTEVSFLNAHCTEKAAPKDLNHIQIDIFGRGNNAYRWAGESDVTEAVESFLAVERYLERGQLIDQGRFVLRGFSMGGAGTWHLGLHHPYRWCLLGPGAGFTTTHGYAKDLPGQLPPYQEACLTIYDAVNYAENAAMVPVVAYAGSDDPQLAAAKNIEERLKPLGIPMTLLIAPGLGHNFPPEWQQKAEAAYAKHLNRERDPYPKKVRFVTYTLKYPGCAWVEIVGLDKHYQKAAVEAEFDETGEYIVKTSNVRVLDLRLKATNREPLHVNINTQKLTATPQFGPGGAKDALHLYLEYRGGKWGSVLAERLETERLRQPQKTAGLTGPIDDAFMTPFLCVRGTGIGWHKGTEAYAEANLERFRREWSKYMRGDLVVKNDADVTPEDLVSRHLVLFGDPASNSLIEQALVGLPLQWTRDKITWHGMDYRAADHVPVLIYPSPFNPSRYLVLNSGHTFRAEDFTKTNAMLFPRLGDHALLKRSGDAKKPLDVEVVTAGLFDDYWRWQP